MGPGARAGRARQLTRIWQDSEAAAATLQKLSQLRDSIAPVIDQQKRTSDLLELVGMADPDMESELSAEAESIGRAGPVGASDAAIRRA